MCVRMCIARARGCQGAIIKMGATLLAGRSYDTDKRGCHWECFIYMSLYSLVQGDQDGANMYYKAG